MANEAGPQPNAEVALSQQSVYVKNTTMKKLTISVSDDVYTGLHQRVGRRRISRSLDELARPHVVAADLSAAYRDMADDDDRECEAREWVDAVVADASIKRGDVRGGSVSTPPRHIE